MDRASLDKEASDSKSFLTSAIAEVISILFTVKV